MAIANTPGRAETVELRVIEPRRSDVTDGDHPPPPRVMWSDKK
jgi:hypothetical protein